MTDQNYSFTKAERLCSKKLIDSLFSNKDRHENKIYVSPFIAIWDEIELSSKYPAQVLISVGKKYSKKAVDRNKVKRQIRELYRLNKHLLYNKLDSKNKQIALLLLFAGKNNLSYSYLKFQFEKLLDNIIKTI